jgi:hypothetical protein
VGVAEDLNKIPRLHLSTLDHAQSYLHVLYARHHTTEVSKSFNEYLRNNPKRS